MGTKTKDYALYFTKPQLFVKYTVKDLTQFFRYLDGISHPLGIKWKSKLKSIHRSIVEGNERALLRKQGGIV